MIFHSGIKIDCVYMVPLLWGSFHCTRNKFDCSLLIEMHRLNHFHCTSIFHCCRMCLCDKSTILHWGLRSHTCLHERGQTHNHNETRLVWTLISYERVIVFFFLGTFMRIMQPWEFTVVRDHFYLSCKTSICSVDWFLYSLEKY